MFEFGAGAKEPTISRQLEISIWNEQRRNSNLIGALELLKHFVGAIKGAKYFVPQKLGLAPVSRVLQ